ncbi:OB-fold-like, putative isoform 3 [Theobroma cacao]|uniref:OB-fold-like, putative isoform 3 n=1 Tax=Theobroma cacao TaxID=3641 RepID=A0A061EKP9_THECC|nr:OB-fold-like, putative isoform 3 [Theobroma cacao]
MGKKKRAEVEAEPEPQTNNHTNPSLLNGDAHKKKKKKKKTKAEKETNSEAKADEIPTVSIAVAGSIIDNAQSLELATRLASQIARAATIFRIDEVVVFDSKSNSVNNGSFSFPTQNNSNENERGAAFLVRILQYLETPQYLRKALFPKHNSLRPRQVVSSSKPREEAGTYWGYKVRYASNISSVFSECPYKGGYDHLIGTSEHGLIVNSSELTLPVFRHLLIAFGGLSGLEKSVEEDHKLQGKNVRNIFDLYLNTCPHQGSRTIRTEEALYISLQYFQEPIARALQRARS